MVVLKVQPEFENRPFVDDGGRGGGGREDGGGKAYIR